MWDNIQRHLGNSPVQSIQVDGLCIDVKRDDLIHTDVSGNKWRKLKYHLLKAENNGCDTLITFGGPFSNHLAATARAAHLAGFKSIGIIRGEYPDLNSSTLKFVRACGMQLIPVPISEYNERNNYTYHDQLKLEYPSAHIVPEGGAGIEGISGVLEIVKELNTTYDYIACAVGTGTTAAGLILSKPAETKILCFNNFKRGEEVRSMIDASLFTVLGNHEAVKEHAADYEVVLGYDFGGYAKVNDELKNFVTEINSKCNLPLDLVYTGKAFYGLLDMLKTGQLKQESKILFYHSGGLQGNAGFGFSFS